jgi:hypothetical protein
MVRASYSLPLILALTGCTRAVYMPTPIPETFLVPCVFTADPRTNGELLEAYEDARTVIAKCNERVKALRELNRGL